MHSRRALVVAAVLVTAGGLAGPLPATAAVAVGSVQKVGEVLVYTAYPGIANDVEVSPDGLGGLEINDDAGSIDLIGPECVPSPTTLYPNKITCAVAGVTELRLDGGDLGDVLYVRDPMSVLLIGGLGDDTLYGSIGDDHLDGGPGNDVLFGGPGDDLLVGGPGADQLDGASGIDTVSYAAYSAAVVVDADGQPGDDGVPGEGDSVGLAVENITGGAGSDMLRGNDLDNTLRGLGGNDRIYGLFGVDALYGDAGYDYLDAGLGPRGGYENDLCSPGAEGAFLTNCEVITR